MTVFKNTFAQDCSGANVDYSGNGSGQGITEFGAEGDEFNPEIHEAVQDLSQGDSKVVGTVLRKGYMIGDRLVRNAMVIIAEPAEPAQAQQPAHPSGPPQASGPGFDGPPMTLQEELAAARRLLARWNDTR